MSSAAVVFPALGAVEAWYECPGHYRLDPTGEYPWRRTYVPGSACGFRAPWDDPEWSVDRHGDKACRCGGEPPLLPVACNWQVICEDICEHDGCDLSDCVMHARDQGECPLGCPATLREVRFEPIALTPEVATIAQAPPADRDRGETLASGLRARTSDATNRLQQGAHE